MAKESTQTDPGLGPGSSKKGTDPGIGSAAPPAAAPPREPSRDVSVDTLLTGLLGPDAEPKLIKRSSGEQAIAFAAPAHAVPAAHTDASAEPAVVLRQSLVDDAEVIGVPAPAVEVWVPGGGTPKNGTRRLTPAAGVVKPAAGARPTAEPASQPKQRVAAPLAFERPGLDEKAAPKRSATPAAGGLFLGAAVAPGTHPAGAEPHVNLTPTAPPTGALEMSPETVRSKPRLDPDASGKATIVTRQQPADRRGWLILGVLLLLGAFLCGWLILRERPGSGTEPASTLNAAPPSTPALRADIPPPAAVSIVADPPAPSVQPAPTARPTGRRPAASATAAPSAPATVAVLPPQPAPTASAVAPQPATTGAKGSSGDPAPPPAGFSDLKGEIRK